MNLQNCKRRKVIFMRKSKKYIPRGRTFSTYDDYLGKQHKFTAHKKRPVVAIDVNSYGEMMVVPLSSKKGVNRTHLKNYQDGKSYFKHYVEIEDDEGFPIVPNIKFRANHKNMDLSVDNVNLVRDVVFTKSKQKQRNNILNKKFHKRKK